MTIPRLPGIGDEMAQYLPQLGQQLASIFAPQIQQQRQLQQALQANPALASELANLEAQRPGLLEMLGFGKIGQQIGAMGATPEAQVQQAVAARSAELIKDPANLTSIAGAASGLTQARAQETQTAATKQGMEINAAQEGRAKKQEVRVQGLEDRFNEISTTLGDTAAIAEAIKTGRLTGLDVEAVAASPAWNAIKQLLDTQFQREEMELRARLQKEQRAMMQDEWVRQAAIQSFRDSGYTGDIAGHMALMNPATSGAMREIAMDYVNNPAKLNDLPPEDRRKVDGLVRSYIGMGRAADEVKQQEYQQLTTNFRNAVAAYNSAKGAPEKEAAIALMNQVAQRSAQIGGQPFTVEVDNPWHSGPRAVIKQGGESHDLESFGQFTAPAMSDSWVTQIQNWNSGTIPSSSDVSPEIKTNSKVIGAINYIKSNPSAAATIDKNFPDPKVAAYIRQQAGVK